MVDLRATKSARERLKGREAKNARKRWVLYACLLGCAAFVVSIPFFIEAGASRRHFRLVIFGGTLAIGTYFAWRHRYRRQRCDSCGRKWAMRKLSRREYGYVRLECRHCGARKRGTIPEKEAGKRW